MYTDCLPQGGHATLARLREIAARRDLILAGGTALALHLGHRKSSDFDFFTASDFSTETLYQEILRLDLEPRVVQEEAGTLTVIIGGLKVSIFHYPYPFMDQMEDLAGISVAGCLDIASMKTVAISQRGAKRDFVDLYFVMQDIPFRKIAENMIQRFGARRINPVHTGKSLVYFDDAESDPEPQYSGKATPVWSDIRQFFRDNVRQMVTDLHNVCNRRTDPR